MTDAAAITAARLLAFAPDIAVPGKPTSDYMAAEIWAAALEAARGRFRLYKPRHVACWLGQLHVESQGFARFEENLNYRTPARLDAMFSAVRGTRDAADLIRRGPVAIANRVYAGRNGNGDEASGDGWAFRGSGPIQTTGRRNFKRASAWTGVDLEKDPGRLRTDPAIGALAAAGYWAMCDLNDEAERLDVDAITHAVNGPAMAGAADRRAQTQRALRLWGAA